MNVKFFLAGGSIVDWKVPDPASFNFMAFTQNVRAAGFFLAPDVYIQHEHIAMIALEGATVQMPVHMTKN